MRGTSIGYLRYYGGRIGVKLRSMFAVANLHELSFFQFSPGDIDAGRKIINGLFWDREAKAYIRKETAYPDICDDQSAFRSRDPELYKELAAHCYMIYRPIGYKSDVFERIKGTAFEKYLIETYRFRDINVRDILNRHGSLALKPDNSGRGTGVFKLSLRDGAYCLKSGHDQERVLTPDEFEAEYCGQFMPSYIVQPFIGSVTGAGNPFDIRLHLRRGKGGKWDTVLIYPRIGSSNGIVSNVKRGGSVSRRADLFLEQEIGGGWKQVNDELIYIAKKLPEVLQGRYKNKKLIDSLAVDVGIDRLNNNELRFFEINTNPGVETLPFESSEVTIEFYKHLIKLKQDGKL